jgi:hypothetical protein
MNSTGVASRASHRILEWLSPGDKTERVVYGIITVGAVIAIESANNLAAKYDIEATIIVLLVYWLAHSYSAVMGHIYNSKERWTVAQMRVALREESSLIRGASLPIVAMIVAALVQSSATAVTWVGMISVVVLLMMFQAVAGQRAGMKGLALMIQMLIGLFFGLALIGVKYLLP